MAAGKNPYLRYRIINACLTTKQKKYWSRNDLMARLAEHDLYIESRTLDHDMQNMRFDTRLAYYAPINYCRANKGYHYTDANYSIDSLPLTEEEIRSLYFAANMLQQYKDTKLVNEFHGAFDKVVKVVKQLKPAPPVKTIKIAFETSPYYKGLEHFDYLYKAIDEGQPLCITYKKFLSQDEAIYILHPYCLKEFKNRWYLVGFSEKHKLIITLGLDRIEAIREELITFKSNQYVNLEEYFQYTIGITHSNLPIEEIKLWFSPQQAHYVKTQHVHHTQKILSDNDSGLIITLQLIPNYELFSFLLSLGPEVKIIAPVTVKEKVQSLYLKSMALYGEIS